MSQLKCFRRRLKSKVSMLRLLSVVTLAFIVTACGGGVKKTSSGDIKASSIPPEKAYGYALKEMKKQQFEAAASLLEIAVTMPEVGAEQYANLGIAYSRTEKYDDSIKAFDKALGLAPGNADVLTEKGLVFREQGKFAEARKQYERALATDPAHSRANYNLGILCDLYKQDLDCAIRHYQQYLATSELNQKNVKVWLKDLARRKKKAAGGS